MDGAGKVYVNIECSNEVVEIDAAKNEVTRRTSILPCEGPSGLAIDMKDKKLFSVCDGVMAVTDIPTFKVVATPKIGQGPDAAGYDPGTGLAFSSNGQDGTLSIVKQVNGKWDTVDTVTDRSHCAHHGRGRLRLTRYFCWPPKRDRRRLPRMAKKGVRRFCRIPSMYW